MEPHDYNSFEGASSVADAIGLVGTNGEPAIIPLRGMDSTCRVFLYNSQVIRGIFEDYDHYYRNILSLCQDHDLFRFGIVPTTIRNDITIPGMHFSLYLEHERVPCITYPNEWPASMLKDAALFICDLNISLSRYNLVLSDLHAYNILFKGTRPVYVDFTSVMFFDDLGTLRRLQLLLLSLPFIRLGERPLVNLFGVLYLIDFVPSFLRELLLFAAGKHRACRSLLGRFPDPFRYPVITARECFSLLPSSAISTAHIGLLLLIALKDSDPCKPQFWRTLSQQVSRLEVQPETSIVTSASGFTISPRLLEDAIRSKQPRTVLDLYTGGSIAIAAAHMGCDVVVLDTDEVCMDRIYLQAREKGLSIIPLVVDPESLLVTDRVQEPDQPAILLPPLQRLRCDMVVVCGQNFITHAISPKQIAYALDRLAGLYLLIFVPAGYGSSSELWEKTKTALEPYFPVINVQESPDPGLDLYMYEKCSPVE